MNAHQEDQARRDRAAADLDVLRLFPPMLPTASPAEAATSPLHSPLVMSALVPANSEEAGRLLEQRLRALSSDNELEYMSTELWCDEGMPAPDGELVEIELMVEETVRYPASAMIPAAEYESLRDLFPHLREDDLPLGLLLMAIRRTGGKLVVNERHGDVQGRVPVGPVTRKVQSDEFEQGRG